MHICSLRKEVYQQQHCLHQVYEFAFLSVFLSSVQTCVCFQAALKLVISEKGRKNVIFT